MGRGRYIAVVVISTIVISLAIYLAPYAESLFGKSRSSIIFLITFRDDQGERIQLSRDIVLYTQVFATTVEGSRFEDVKVEVLRGRVNESVMVGSIIVLKPEGKFGEVVREWVEYIEKRSLNPKTSSSVQINLWVVNTSSGEIIARLSRYYTYEPVAIASGKSIVIEVDVAISSTNGGLRLLYEHKNQDINCILTYWERLWHIGPENFTGKPYVIYDPGDATYYTKTPLIAVINHALSPIITTIIAPYRTSWSASIGMGYGLQEKGLDANVTIYKAGIVREDYVYFGYILLANPGETKNIYVWARPIAEFYREIEMNTCTGISTPTGYEKLDTYVKSVRIIDKYGSKYYDGGVDYGLQDWLYQWFYGSPVFSENYIGFLAAGDGRHLAEIIRKYVDVCSADFEIPIPVGAMAATLLASHGFSPIFTEFVASMSASAGDTDPLRPSFSGGIDNNGFYLVYIYLRLTNYKYRLDPPWRCLQCSPCYHNVPVSMIFIVR